MNNYKISQIELVVKHDDNDLKQAICETLKISEEKLAEYSISKKSIDARRKNRIKFVYTINASTTENIDTGKLKNVEEYQEKEYFIPEVGSKEQRPVIVGAGPCGLFSALILARAGLKPIIIERGKPVEERISDVTEFWQIGKLDTESNVQFGEGGAGTFSDGKLTTQIKDKHGRLQFMLKELVAAGAPEEIMYSAKPHIGTDKLSKAVKNIRQTIISLGGEYLFNTKVTGVCIQGNAINGVIVNNTEKIVAGTVIFAIGHSSRDTFKMLHENGIEIEQKAFAIGARIEHPQDLINKAQFGKIAGHPKLGAADYKLVHHCPNGRSAYTFCMCPGGEVIGSSSEEGMVVTNGMSYFSRNKENANSAFLVGVKPRDFGSEHPLAGIAFQRKWERLAFEAAGKAYGAPVQRVGDLLNNKPSKRIGKVQPSYKPGYMCTDLSEVLPSYVIETFQLALPEIDKKLKGFAMSDAILTGVETRSSSPVRITRDETLQSVNIKGLYPAGEGSGYAGGITSSAVDGMKCAEAIIASFVNT